MAVICPIGRYFSGDRNGRRVRVRDATAADAEAVRAVHYRSIRDLGRPAYDEEQAEAWAAGCATADYTPDDDPAVEYVVAESDGVVVGFGALYDGAAEDIEEPVDATVTAVYVDPSVARQGVGTRLHDVLEERARDRGAERLGLTASLPAVAFYEAQGYERVRERDHEFSADEDTGVTGTVVEMVMGLEEDQFSTQNR